MFRLLSLLLCAGIACAQMRRPIDSDHDGLNDVFEDALLQRFAPTFMISSNDCSAQPARFVSGIAIPTVAADDGTVYGQATLRAATSGVPAEIELHYYHLWRKDCGRMGHPLDAEHVAVLLQQNTGTLRDDTTAWRAAFWYAAAHEDTVCDASQITRASTLKAEESGPRIWISAGKHASFLTEEMCHHGCGGDRCTKSRPLPSPGVINLGELNAPMNGAVWINSSRWPLTDKLGRSDFLAARTDRLQRLPETDIAWANPAKRPAQAAILGGNSAVDGAIAGGGAAGSALAVSSRSTDSALTVTADKTGTALGTATRKTGHALSTSVHAVKKALGGSTKSQEQPK
jgi:hypothetical protein